MEQGPYTYEIRRKDEQALTEANHNYIRQHLVQAAEAGNRTLGRIDRNRGAGALAAYIAEYVSREPAGQKGGKEKEEGGKGEEAKQGDWGEAK